MALSTILLLSLLLLIVPSHRSLDPTSATPVISQETDDAWDITAGSHLHDIQCKTVQESVGLNTSFAMDPTVSFDSSSGGHNFNCSLRSGDARGGNQQVNCIYYGPTKFTELSVGVQHMATIKGDPMKMQTIRWRSYNCHNGSQDCRDFPKSVNRGIREVHCWGPHTKSLTMRFDGLYMRSVTAGVSHMCGLNMTGRLICSREQLIVPPGEAVEFTSLVLGLSHTCAIRQKDGIVICRGQDGSYFPVGSTVLEFLIAGGDFTCGLTTDGLNVVCWALNGRNLSSVTVALPQILPAVCIPDETFCSCGVLPESDHRCGKSGIICKGPKKCLTEPFELLVASSLTLATWEWMGRGWFALAIVAAVLCTAGIVYLACWKCWRARRSEDNNNSLPAQVDGPAFPYLENLQSFQLRDLGIATRNFAISTCLGLGRDGTVHRGKLSDGRSVAVKKFDRPSSPQTNIVFNRELSIASRLNHPNVVALISYCSENGEKLSVLQLMKRRDLRVNLFPKDSKLQTPLISFWETRIRVLADVAEGIAYLHLFAQPRIIHRDIRLSNILLDKHWGAKISDFGLAVCGPEEGSTYVDGEVIRVDGYTAPECRNSQCVRPNCDVYSFGVVMFLVLTGQQEFETFTGCREIVNAIGASIFSGDILDILDKRPHLPAGEDQMKAVVTVARLALSCVSETHSHRPTIKYVVLTLQSALKLFTDEHPAVAS